MKLVSKSEDKRLHFYQLRRENRPYDFHIRTFEKGLYLLKITHSLLAQSSHLNVQVAL